MTPKPFRVFGVGGVTPTCVADWPDVDDPPQVGPAWATWVMSDGVCLVSGL
ncbi:hypothetical protein OS176_01615 [Xanthomonadaceae bacterium XH05]|nr:hypothetical protein [Xanthomonadaceae bacterium XH05]